MIYTYQNILKLWKTERKKWKKQVFCVVETKDFAVVFVSSCVFNDNESVCLKIDSVIAHKNASIRTKTIYFTKQFEINKIALLYMRPVKICFVFKCNRSLSAFFVCWFPFRVRYVLWFFFCLLVSSEEPHRITE